MRILFIGTGGIGVPVLQSLFDNAEHQVIAVVTQPDKPAGRKQELQPSPIKQVALVHGVPVLQPVRMRAPESVASIQALAPELIVVMAYGQILPKEILDAPTIACLNLHASLLPKYRGAAPIQAAMEAGDAETGITVMYMDVGLDTGDILLEKRIPIRRRETGGTLHDRLAAISPAALAEALPLLAQGTAPRIPQDSALTTYAPKLTRESGIIDWSAPHLQIDRKIRAMNPWPAASTSLPGKDGRPQKLKIFTVIPHRKCTGAPGEVLHAGKNGILVAAGTGGILLREVQLEGKKRMPARDFLSGNPVTPGTILGAAQ
ncbi:MAG: methionyl-tRNA formyltransferase [Chthoniobacteraceae bacterium]